MMASTTSPNSVGQPLSVRAMQRQPQRQPTSRKSLSVAASAFPTPQDKKKLATALFNRRQRLESARVQEYLQKLANDRNMAPLSQSTLDDMMKPFHMEQQEKKDEHLRKLDQQDFSPTNRHARMFGAKETDGLDLKRALFQVKQQQDLNALINAVEAFQNSQGSKMDFSKYVADLKLKQQEELAKFERDLMEASGSRAIQTKVVPGAAQEEVGFLGKLLKSFARP